MRSRTILIALTAALTAAFSATAGATDVDLQAADGITPRATYTRPGQPGPGMLLVHQCNMDRSSWQGFTLRLVDAGVHVLALNLRGFGDSGGEGMRGEGGFGGFMQKSTADVDMAYDYLMNQPGVDGGRVGVGEASCGAMLTVKGSSTAPRVNMLTPGMAPNSMPPMRPATKIISAVGSRKSACVPARKSTIS